MNRRPVDTGAPEFQSRAPQDSPAKRGGLLFDARQLAAYVVYVARTFKAFHLVVAMTLLALVLEYAATSLMIPLAPGNIAAESAVTAFWTRVAAVFEVPRSTKRSTADASSAAKRSCGRCGSRAWNGR